MSPLANHAQLPAKSPPKQPKPLKVTGKNKAAIDLMVWEGLKRADAAAKAGLKDHALYVALTKPHVKQYYLGQLDVLRTSERARNIHRAVEIREQTSNQMASIQAIKLLEQISDDAPASRGAQSVPGLVIVVNGGASVAAQTGSNILDLVPERASDDPSQS